MSSVRELHSIIVGCSPVGKSTLIRSYLANGYYYGADLLTMDVEDFYANINVDSVDYELPLTIIPYYYLEYESMRQAYYKYANCFLLCYSIDDRDSFDGIRDSWAPDIRWNSKAPMVLVATKVDLREPDTGKCVTTDEGQQLAKDIGAYSYVECSAKNMFNVSQVLEEAVRAALAHKKRKKQCTIS